MPLWGFPSDAEFYSIILNSFVPIYPTRSLVLITGFLSFSTFLAAVHTSFSLNFINFLI